MEPLTDRELEVLALVAEGATNQEIARELVVSLATVKTHINHIFGKLDAESCVQVVARARALGLLTTLDRELHSTRASTLNQPSG